MPKDLIFSVLLPDFFLRSCGCVTFTERDCAVTDHTPATETVIFYLTVSFSLHAGDAWHKWLQIGLQICKETICLKVKYIKENKIKIMHARFTNTALNSSQYTHTNTRHTHTLRGDKTADMTTQRHPHTRRQRKSCRWDSRFCGGGGRHERGTHRVMWSVPLRDWLAVEAAGSTLGWAEPMALQGGVLGLPGQQAQQSEESKALHTHVHTETHIHTHTHTNTHTHRLQEHSEPHYVESSTRF